MVSAMTYLVPLNAKDLPCVWYGVGGKETRLLYTREERAGGSGQRMNTLLRVRLYKLHGLLLRKGHG